MKMVVQSLTRWCCHLTLSQKYEPCPSPHTHSPLCFHRPKMLTKRTTVLTMVYSRILRIVAAGFVLLLIQRNLFYDVVVIECPCFM
ncbi:hypothetical protein MtrunA17_Chr8g0347541 [Medicago truncatula]|uniref:Transmembrane protein n=1 Tax=Medicago truncatula TaxID=3880 RepID=A0A396GEG7_MEDTR|nr:hypothetical protein MtrunA17_Chr8g0347541 [Medicago truncatula]